MPELSDEILSALRDTAHSIEERAFVPYSGFRSSMIMLLSDGSWVPGVRVESASFSLMISPVVNAYTTAITLGRTDIVALVQSTPFKREDEVFLTSMFGEHLNKVDADVYALENSLLVGPSEPLRPFFDGVVVNDPKEGIQLAREVARGAHVPESGFPVGCILEDVDGRLIPGVNVEHEDWTRILCAERNALSTAISYSITDFRALYLSCLKDSSCTPCGACRQLIAEHSRGVEIWMDRGTADPELRRPADLLPGFFSGQAVSRKPALPENH